jgi:uncharacterized membrane protein
MSRMVRLATRVKNSAARFWGSFSYVGLAVATIFFAASLTPSLLPRHFVTQGLLSGFALAAGYGVGVLLVVAYLFLEIPKPRERLQRFGKRVTTVSVATVVIVFLWRETVWQNSIRDLMEMEPVATAEPFRVAMIALITAAVLIVIARGLIALWLYVNRKVSRFIPRRIAYVATTVIVAVTLLLLVNNVIARMLLRAADAVFVRWDNAVDDGVEQPTDPLACGSAQSLVAWDKIGRMGKDFIVGGAGREKIGEFWGRPATQPVRVYVGLGAEDTPRLRAKLALQELKRARGFERKVLIVATPTGTGWLDPGGVDTIEYLHGGDTAIVAVQYSYLPSWITLLVDPSRAQSSASALFDEIYDHWKTLPKDARPKFYVHGLSLGGLGSTASTDLFTVFEDPIQGGLWSGTPFASAVWSRATANRNPGSPMWLPRFRDGSMVRFTGRENTLPEAGRRWGPMRFVFIQHASDPMVFFSPDLLYRRPQWLIGERGPDVSPYLRWYPIVTFLQCAFDLTMATAVPTGYGHRYAPSSYIDGWVEVTQPQDWSAAQSARLKQMFRK